MGEPRISMRLKHKKHEESDTISNHNQSVQNQHQIKILKVTKENKYIMYKETKIKMTADFLLETMQVKSQWNNIVRVLKNKHPKPKTVYLEFYTKRKKKKTLKKKGEINTFKNIQNPK